MYLYRSLVRRIAAALMVCSWPCVDASAQTFPSKPIRMLVGFPTGGGADVAARVIAPRLSESLGQQIIIDNRPGAGSAIASEITAKAVPDGHTLVMVGSSHAVNAALYPKLNFKSADDFNAVVLVATAPVAITAHPGVAARNVKELIALAKAKPGHLNYGSAGVNGINHLAAELLKRTAGIDLTLVPYKGVAQALPAVMAGEIQLMFASLPGSVGAIRNGKIIAIAVTSLKRSNAAPDIPTVSESGVPGFDASSWFGMLAPAGVPKAVVARLNKDTIKVVEMKETQEALIRQGMDPTTSTPAELDAYLRSEIAKWTRVAKEANIKPD